MLNLRCLERLSIRIYKTLFPYSFRKKLVSSLLTMEHLGGEFRDTGEDEAIKKVHNKLKRIYPNQTFTVFDVGANVGAYSKEIVKHFGESVSIHAFEPMKSTFDMLSENVRPYSAIRCHNIGLSNKSQTMSVFSNQDGSGFASVYRRRLDHLGIEMNIEQTCEFSSIDDFCRANSIDRIHFLKIDVEGHEFSVLQGAKAMLEGNRIDFIQFEFGGCNIDSRTFFRDFWYLLSDKYNLYEIVPDGVFPIKNYRETQEIFVYQNFLAELKTIND